MSSNAITLTLFNFGGVNIIGNIVTGKMLTHSPIKAVVAFPLLLSPVYIILFFTGHLPLPMTILTFIWGIFDFVFRS